MGEDISRNNGSFTDGMSKMGDGLYYSVKPEIRIKDKAGMLNRF